MPCVGPCAGEASSQQLASLAEPPRLHVADEQRLIQSKPVNARLLGLDGQQVIGIAYDSPEITPNELIRYDCAIVDPGFNTRDSPLTPLTLAFDTYATLAHDAPYAEIFATYRVLSVTWLVGAAHQYGVETIRAYELYREPPWENSGRTQRFDLMLPVKKRK